MWSAIVAFVQLLANVTGIWKSKDDQKNAEDVKAAAANQAQVDEKNRIENDVAKGDIDAIRKDVSEG
jgi:uncharacterized protein YyaL (SSP411 family)